MIARIEKTEVREPATMAGLPMDPVFKKLQFKAADRILVVGAPPEFESHLEAMAELTTVDRQPASRRTYEFAIYFVRDCADIRKHANAATTRLAADGTLWFAYPKKSSKRYTSDIGRDDGWQPLGDAGFEGVRQIAIDDDWSALRFRSVENIRTMRRDPKRSMTAVGKQRTGST